MCHFVLVFFSPFSISITSLGEERANLNAFRMFVRFVLVLICRFPLPLRVWEGLWFVIVVLHGLFSYLFFSFIFYFIIFKLDSPNILNLVSITFSLGNSTKRTDVRSRGTYCISYLKRKYLQMPF